MELYLDKAYEMHCENKFNYTSFSIVSTVPAYTISSLSSGTVYQSDNVLLIYSPVGVAETRVTRSDGAVMSEIMLSNTIKKIILE